MYLIRIFNGTEIKAYLEFYDETALLEKIGECLQDDVKFDVHVCKCVLDQS